MNPEASCLRCGEAVNLTDEGRYAVSAVGRSSKATRAYHGPLCFLCYRELVHYLEGNRVSNAG